VKLRVRSKFRTYTHECTWRHKLAKSGNDDFSTMLPTAVLKEMCPLLGLDTASIMSMVEGGEDGPSRNRLRGPGGKRLSQVGPDVYRVSHTPRSLLTLLLFTGPSHHVLIFASVERPRAYWVILLAGLPAFQARRLTTSRTQGPCYRDPRRHGATHSRAGSISPGAYCPLTGY